MLDSLANTDDLPDRIGAALRETKGEYCTARRLTPQLTYGRHRGPAPASARAASVLILLFREDGAWHIPLIVRPDTIAHHRGQIGLPGGVAEPGESSDTTALREFEEELGVRPRLEMLGHLPRCYVFASDFLVTPWIAVTAERPIWHPQIAEVARVIELPVATLWDTLAIGEMTIKRGLLNFRAPCYKFDADKVWGATSVILNELADMVATS